MYARYSRVTCIQRRTRHSQNFLEIRLFSLIDRKMIAPYNRSAKRYRIPSTNYTHACIEKAICESSLLGCGLSFPTKSDREHAHERSRSLPPTHPTFTWLETWNHDKTVYLSLGKMSLETPCAPNIGSLPLSFDASDCISSAKATWE